ncbi:hypothetical protein GWK47_004819 [Chionoecetes opilio]|uniref:Uncharacterized protein n=1 Tax=Chionoecetes opilio TaxID=41210 RepID=A0A8J4YKI0_CHIOP|nr:hypothetical protein GWK47_004819 [Chionoecetes opilio]
MALSEVNSPPSRCRSPPPSVSFLMSAAPPWDISLGDPSVPPPWSNIVPTPSPQPWINQTSRVLDVAPPAWDRSHNTRAHLHRLQHHARPDQNSVHRYLELSPIGILGDIGKCSYFRRQFQFLILK